MQIHQIKPSIKNRKKRVGRGGKRGTYSGRGVKGQNSRAGNKKAPVIREVIKKYHKLRGYRFNSFSPTNQVVNLAVIEKNFENQEIISPKTLSLKKIVKKDQPVKILGKGLLKKSIIVEGCLVSRSAVKKIESVGGKVK